MKLTRKRRRLQQHQAQQQSPLIPRDILVASSILEAAVKLVQHSDNLQKAGYWTTELPEELDNIRGLLRGAFEGLNTGADWEQTLTAIMTPQDGSCDQCGAGPGETCRQS